MGIDTRQIQMKEEEDRIQVEIDYELEMNYEHLADCNIKMNICASK